MAQPHQYPPRAFSPPQHISSSNHPPFLGPNKRQRLSPNPQSPYSSPNLSNIALPNQVFSSPYWGAQPNGTMPPQANHATIPPPQTGVMGPPSRPADNKPTDMNELTDVLLQSGVDLKEEEAALLNRQHPPTHRPAETPFSNIPTSVNPQGLIFPGRGAIPSKSNFLSHNIPGDKSSFYGAGMFNQLPGPYQTSEERAQADLKRANRMKLERRQYHLNEPFLWTGQLHKQITKVAQKFQVAIPTAGLLSSTDKSGNTAEEVAVTGPDKNEVIVTLTGQDLIYQDSPLVEILALMSLAAEERLRSLVESAATLAKDRRIGSRGIVPADLADVVMGDGAPASVAALPTPGNSAISPKSNPLKRSYSSIIKPLTPISDISHTPTTTIAFPNPVAQALRQIASAERSAEEERLAKRARRAASGALAGEGNKSGTVSLGASAPGTPGNLSERAPDVETKKVSKKEQKRQAEVKATEAQQHASTNQTTSMALGIGGSLGKTLSWMQKPGPSGSSVSTMLPRVNTGSQGVSKSSAMAGAGSASQLQRIRRYGDFREDKETGAGIQSRDMIFALESDGKEKRALARAYAKLK